MIAYVGREITTLVAGALSKSEGKTPRQVYSEVEIGSLTTIRTCLRILCDTGRAKYEGRIGSRLYFRARVANKGSCWQGEGLDRYQPRTRIDDFTTPLEEAERLNHKSVVEALKPSTSV